MVSVGLLVLARNEEAMIRRCLESVRPAVDEAVVLDMESSDRTSEFAAALGATVLTVPTTTRFDGTRQVGADALSTDWVLQLDADEWAPGVVPLLRSTGFFDQRQPIAVPKVNFLGDRWIKRNGWWPNYQVRLFRRGTGRYVSHFHNYLRTDEVAIRVPAREDFAIRHAGHGDAREMFESVARYLPSSQPLSFSRSVRVSMKPLARFALSRGWRDGTDGYAILLAKLANRLAQEFGDD